jgi:hypothetical protein
VRSLPVTPADSRVPSPGRRALLAGCAALVAGSVVLTGCAAPGARPDVVGAAPWPASPAPGHDLASPPPGIGDWPPTAPPVSASPSADHPEPGRATPPELPRKPVCPPAGVRMELGEVSAAMGLRAMTVHLINCGEKSYRVEGYPDLRALDDERSELAVQVRHGAHDITEAVPDMDAAPEPVTLKPGEQAAAGLVWRNTYDDTTNLPVDVPYLKVAPAEGRPSQLLAVESPLDLGSTGKLGVGPWRPLES